MNEPLAQETVSRAQYDMLLQQHDHWKQMAEIYRGEAERFRNRLNVLSDLINGPGGLAETVKRDE